MGNGVLVREGLKGFEFTYSSLTLTPNGYLFVNLPHELEGKTIYAISWVTWETAGVPPTGCALYENDQFIIYGVGSELYTNFKIRFIYQ